MLLVDALRLSANYHYSRNNAYYDGLQLYREEFSQAYEYDANGNLTGYKSLIEQEDRTLKDIHALGAVKNSLKALRIENCPRIEDFSVLAELEKLELLHLYGKNVLPSLDFIKKMKNLKTFLFNMPVLDGDLTPCLDLSYVHSGINRRHYNIKDKDLPKNHYVWGNEDLEEWIRLE